MKITVSIWIWWDALSHFIKPIKTNSWDKKLDSNQKLKIQIKTLMNRETLCHLIAQILQQAIIMLRQSYWLKVEIVLGE